MLHEEENAPPLSFYFLGGKGISEFLSKLGERCLNAKPNSSPWSMMVSVTEDGALAHPLLFNMNVRGGVL